MIRWFVTSFKGQDCAGGFGERGRGREGECERGEPCLGASMFLSQPQAAGLTPGEKQNSEVIKHIAETDGNV